MLTGSSSSVTLSWPHLITASDTPQVGTVISPIAPARKPVVTELVGRRAGVWSQAVPSMLLPPEDRGGLCAMLLSNYAGDPDCGPASGPWN